MDANYLFNLRQATLTLAHFARSWPIHRVEYALTTGCCLGAVADALDEMSAALTPHAPATHELLLQGAGALAHWADFRHHLAIEGGVLLDPLRVAYEEWSNAFLDLPAVMIALRRAQTSTPGSSGEAQVPSNLHDATVTFVRLVRSWVSQPVDHPLRAQHYIRTLEAALHRVVASTTVGVPNVGQLLRDGAQIVGSWAGWRHLFQFGGGIVPAPLRMACDSWFDAYFAVIGPWAERPTDVSSNEDRP